MSTNAIEKAAGMDLLKWTDSQRDLIKRTIAKDATDDELAMFLHVASRAGLDPLLKQIHFMKYQGRVTFVADINGLQARAAREADYEGITHAVVCEGDDFAIDNVTGLVVRHTSNPLAGKGNPVGAWATVWRKGMKPFTVVVRFSEYLNPNNPQWKIRPAVMIDKVAKSTALRLAYPEQLGSLYEFAEMDREVEVNPAPVSVTQASTADLKAQLAAKVAEKRGDVVDAEVVEQPKPAPKGPGAWQQILAMGREAGMEDKAIGARAKLLSGGKTKPSQFTEEDVARFRAWVSDEPPAPSDADAPPPVEAEEALPF